MVGWNELKCQIVLFESEARLQTIDFVLGVGEREGQFAVESD